MTAAEARALAITVSWRSVVLILIAVAAWDAPALLFGGDTAYRSPAYDITRSVPGGIRLWGAVLSVLLVCLVTGFARYERGHSSQLVRWALVGMTGWWTAWGTAIIATWPLHRSGVTEPLGALLGVVLAVGAAALLMSGRPARGWLVFGVGAWLVASGFGLEVPSWSGASRPAALAVLALVAARAVAGRLPERTTPARE